MQHKSKFSEVESLPEVNLPQIDGDIGLLLGNNIPDVCAPLEVKRGERGAREIGLPLRQNVELRENKYMAEQRLKSLKRKLNNRHKFKTDYLKFLNDLFEKGYVVSKCRNNEGRRHSMVPTSSWSI